MKSLFVVLFLVTISTQYPTEDQVYYFDGQPAPMNFQLFSGYLDAGNGKQAHYIFCTAQNSGQASTPIIAYIVGAAIGIKSSVQWEFWQGFGPFVFDYDNLQKFQLKVNEQAWNLNNHLLVIEGMTGIGFSVDVQDNDSDDQKATQEIINALNSFYTKYSEFTKTETWLVGGGYGGVLAPKVITQLLSTKSTLPISSMVLINPLIDVNYTKTRMFDFMWGHFIYSPQIHKVWVQNKCDTDFLTTPTCQQLGGLIMANLSHSNLNILNLYTSCVKANQPMTGDLYSHFQRCLDTDRVTNFLNSESFKQTFHIKNYAPWKLYYPEYNFVQTQAGSLSEFQNIVLNTNIKVLIIHGDTDLKFPVSAVRDLIYDHVLSSSFKITSDWTAFPCDGQVGGYTEDQNYEKLRVTTIRGGGHYPYIWKPVCTNIALKNWSQNKTKNFETMQQSYSYEL